MSKRAPESGNRSARRPYQPPRLKRVGTLKALTQQWKSQSSVDDSLPRFKTKFFPQGPF
ncbi:MAG TPA: hypothetical protein VL086_22185 [Candidatus Nitrosotalea sp.]|nr:hypothetical protein [Candidatus Nitrosotalea sp.]